MANFEIAYKLTGQNEGGVSKDPDDVGGLTFRGLSMRYNPEWPGWRLLDANGELLPGASMDEVVALHRAWFKTRYWDRCGLDHYESQPMANEVYDGAILFGPGRVVEFLDATYRALLGTIVKGINSGPVTANRLFRDGLTRHVIFLLEAQRAVAHMERVIEKPTQRKFLRGWINRLLDEDK